MKINGIDLDDRVLVIAEIGNNHEGAYAYAEEMVGRAAEAGADVVKFQTFVPEHYVTSADVARRQRLRQFQLSYDQFRSLAKVAEAAGATFLSTPFDIASVDFLAEFCPALKIASGDNTFLPLLQAAARTGKPLLLSTGLADHATLCRAIGAVEREWKRSGTPSDSLALLHCVASYPVPNAQANLGAIRTLQHYGYTVGYSDHTMGIDAAVLSVAAGARIVEKHFTLDNNFSDFRDHQLSANPADFAAMVARIREAEAMLGDGIKRPQAAELESERAMRRSVAVSADLPAGTVLTLDHLTWVRPGDGVAPGDEHLVLGRRLAKPMAEGQLILPDDLS